MSVKIPLSSYPTLTLVGLKVGVGVFIIQSLFTPSPIVGFGTEEILLGTLRLVVIT